MDIYFEYLAMLSFTGCMLMLLSLPDNALYFDVKKRVNITPKDAQL